MVWGTRPRSFRTNFQLETKLSLYKFNWDQANSHCSPFESLSQGSCVQQGVVATRLDSFFLNQLVLHHDFLPTEIREGLIKTRVEWQRNGPGLTMCSRFRATSDSILRLLTNIRSV
jgi:hypothetical protein